MGFTSFYGIFRGKRHNFLRKKYFDVWEKDVTQKEQMGQVFL